MAERPVSVVTGAALRLGRAIAVRLARDGADVVVHYGRSEAEALDTAEEIAALGVRALPVQADLTDPAAIRALFETVDREFGRLDVLVNSAASFERSAFAAITADDWDQVVAVNLRAPFLCSQSAADFMVGGDRAAGSTGLIVNMADLSGLQAWRNYAHHSVSKSGLLHLTKVLARELAPGVRVNAVVPGPILPPPGMDPDSDMWRKAGLRVPLERVGDPSDVASAVAFFVANEYVTGVALHVDGGEHLIGPWGR